RTVSSAAATNARLTSSDLAALPVGARQQIESQRTVVALAQGIAREALETTSSRFTALQQLIDTLGSVNDQKATLDLQARIAAENVMLQNEQTKLEILGRVLLAEERANAQQVR